MFSRKPFYFFNFQFCCENPSFLKTSQDFYTHVSFEVWRHLNRKTTVPDWALQESLYFCRIWTDCSRKSGEAHPTTSYYLLTHTYTHISQKWFAPQTNIQVLCVINPPPSASLCSAIFKGIKDNFYLFPLSISGSMFLTHSHTLLQWKMSLTANTHRTDAFCLGDFSNWRMRPGKRFGWKILVPTRPTSLSFTYKWKRFRLWWFDKTRSICSVGLKPEHEARSSFQATLH